MPSKRVEQQLREVSVLSDAPIADGVLLEAFLADRDEAAFTALVRRYGPLVFGVCRRVLQRTADAEDAFQASFLVLVRRANEIRGRASLGSWLYSVAYRTALHARATMARRQRLEGQVRPMDRIASPEDAAMQRELHQLLDRELNALPDKYREVIVLCDLLGTTKQQAARQLGCPDGTVSSRLARGRELLRKRLVRQGATLSVAALVEGLATSKAPASAPLLENTVKIATMIAAGNAAAVGGTAPKAAALMQGVLKSMLLTKLKIATVLTLLLVVLGATTTLIACHSLAESPSQPKQSPNAPDKQVAQARTEDKPVPDKERLLYDEKNFAHWRDVLRYDLNPAVRIKALKALGAFGANGYGEEVTVAVLDVLRNYDPARDNMETEPVPQPPVIIGPTPGFVGGPPIAGLGMGTKFLQTAQVTLIHLGAKALPSLEKEWEKGTLAQRRFVAETLVHMVELAGGELGFNNKPLPSGDPQAYPPEVVPILLRVVKDNDAIVRKNAIGGLQGAIQFKGDGEAPKRKEIAAALLTVVKEDADPALRSLAASALCWLMETDDDVLIPVLLHSAVEDPDPGVRTEALRALANAPKPAPLVPFMLKVLEEETERYQKANAPKEGALGTAKTIELMVRNNELFNIVASGFFTSDRKATQPEYIAALIAALKTSRSAVARKIVIDTLVWLGSAAKEAVPVLHELLDGKQPEEDKDVRDAAAKAIQQIEAKPK